MLELTRRMALSRTSFTRIAGCYMDGNEDFDGSSSTNFLELSVSERIKKLKLAKEVPFVTTNVNLKKYKYTQNTRKLGSTWQLLMAMNECGLKNDTLMDAFYDVVMEHCRADREYAILAFHDRYGIPARGSDKEHQWESEKVFEYMICIICLLNGEYEPGKPVCGLLFPAFMDRSEDLNHIDVFQTDADRPHNEILELSGINWQSLNFRMQRAAWVGRPGIRLHLYNIGYADIFKRKPSL